MEDCVEEDEQQQQQQQQQEISEELQANRFTIAKEFLDWMHANQAKCAELKPVRVQLRGGYDSDDERNYDIDVISEEFPPQGIAICLQRHARDMEYFFFVTRRRYTRVVLKLPTPTGIKSFIVDIAPRFCHKGNALHFSFPLKHLLLNGE
eukprot:gene1898-2077_t